MDEITRIAGAPRRKPSAVKIVATDHVPSQPERRKFLQVLSAQGIALPAVHFLLAAGNAGAATGATSAAAGGLIVRDFEDSYVELIRLLREAAEVEHALMVQYLYAAFSLKPAYAAVTGYGAPNSNDMLGVAIQEMQHLGKVNELLVALGATPHLVRQDFPYQHDIYPFEFNLEPLSQASLAKYVYTEAPAEALDRSKATSLTDRRFLDLIDRSLGGGTRPNHVGSLYDGIIRTLQEYIAAAPPQTAPLRPWLAQLEDIKREGEDRHYQFFRRVFLGTHEGFNGHPAVWSLPPTDPAYPARPLPINPSAFVGHQNQIREPLALSLAWLSNLHYWSILLLVDFAYQDGAADYVTLAKQQMLGPFMALARHLPTLGAGVPCEPLSTGYAPCRTTASRLRFVISMVREADKLARAIGEQLPPAYPTAVNENALAALSQQLARYA